MRSAGAWDQARAQALHLLRTHALRRLSVALNAHNLDVLVVKGAALAMTHYVPPWARAMSDIDLVVRPGSRDRVLEALTTHGLVIVASADRPLTTEYFGETCLTLPCGAASVMFEVHTTLDKLVARPVDYAGIFDRATPAPALAGLLLPANDDHLLLLALHAAGHDFRHAPASADLDLLLAGGVDEAALVRRAREWRLETALFLSLTLLRESGSVHVPTRLLHAIEPSGLRRIVVNRYSLRIASRDPLQMGWRWVLRQSALRDDLAVWTRGVAGYGGARAVEEALLWARSMFPSHLRDARRASRLL